MKIAFTTLACPDWSFAKILDEAERLGYQGVEIRGVNNEMRADLIPEFSEGGADATKALFKAKGLEIAGFGSSVKFHDEAGYADALVEGRLAVDVCVRMGIQGLRVFGDSVAGGDSAAARASILERVCGGLRELCAYARGKGVDILLEVHGDFNKIENIGPIIEGAKSCPEFGILWDIGNSDTSYGDGWRDFYAVIKPLVRHVHVKDHIRAGGAGAYCLPGQGDIPIADIVATLVGDGYDGWYSFEWEKKWHPELAPPETVLPGYIEYMKKLLG
ncbi:MAG: sugar phosphate isomerase/epimerase [Oscillospiraceae bacterium]|nr:sugar phosphate isomerase/epimerase [Oscillospiraceae bacterium]